MENFAVNGCIPWLTDTEDESCPSQVFWVQRKPQLPMGQIENQTEIPEPYNGDMEIKL